MSSNSTFTSNTSLLPPQLASSNTSGPPSSFRCFNHKSSLISFTAFCITNILLLIPLCILIICFALKKWQKQRSASMAATSNSDMFTYHKVTMEMIGTVGCWLYCCGAWVGEPFSLMVGVYIFTAASTGQVFFHILTCADRHLAVVYPIFYLGFKKRGGVRIRNISLACVWLLFLGLFGLIKLSAALSILPFLCITVLSITVITFFSLSVLCTLIHPGPGPGNGKKGREDKTKIKAFYTMMVILGALLLRLGGHVLVIVLYTFSALSEYVRCGLLVSGVWFNLPCSLVLPLLFLHRAGKLCCKNSNESGSE